MGGVTIKRGPGAVEILPEPDPSLPARVAALEAAVSELRRRYEALLVDVRGALGWAR